MITFLSVTKQFGSGDFALKDLSFHLDEGDFVIISGPSGSGKTTLMKLLIKDQLPTKGEVLYKGESLADLPSRKLPEHRRRIGVVFQDYRLLSDLNVWENIALPLSIIGKPEAEIESRVTDLLSLVSLTDKALMFPKQLSGGEAQRVSLARALATGPSLIFADEPTGNLDKKSSLSIVKLLKQINELGTTVILATHDVVVLDELAKERIIELDRGSLKHDSKPKKVKVIVTEDQLEKSDQADIKVPVESKKQPDNKELTKTEKTKIEVGLNKSKKFGDDNEKETKKAKAETKKPAQKGDDDELLADFTKEESLATVKNKPKKFGFSFSFFKRKPQPTIDKSVDKQESEKKS
ncbi:MAG: ATP-binding cassette domain-containing protein [Candidatus Pacebacteria bacterium]|nr:ATP-binding cassette domain-containing protein [Candidatus Paceibacterota bacterium]